MNIRSLVEMVNAEHDTTYVVDGPFELGESRSVHQLRDRSGEWVLKYHDDPDHSHLEEQQRLGSRQERVSAAGYPVSTFRYIGHAEGTTYTIQRRLAGEPLLATLGGPPDGQQLAALLPQLFELNRVGARPLPPHQ